MASISLHSQIKRNNFPLGVIGDRCALYLEGVHKWQKLVPLDVRCILVLFLRHSE